MELGQILALLLVLGYVILYLRGRYYQRENFEEIEDDDYEGYEDIEDDENVDVIGSGN